MLNFIQITIHAFKMHTVFHSRCAIFIQDLVFIQDFDAFIKSADAQH